MLKVPCPSPMDVRRLPGARILTAILWFILAIGIALGLTLYVKSVLPGKLDEKTALSILHSEALKFLVTRRTVTQIVVEVREGDWLGDWHGVLWATVKFHHGVDLQKAGPGDIRRDGEEYVVKLPDPEILDFAVEPGSEGFMAKATAVPKLQDLFLRDHRREMEERLRQRMMEFAQREGLLPSRQQIIDELNLASAMLTSAANLRLRFE